ncbi:mesoderm induction early response protein 1-like isoform X1 [Agrilus planipennis]|uniref:Mesoderm induction early response protein 1-like isoform X1 n=1 Tax=Agrilus planipennis TaxID=224129 RepID=A0A1W4WYE6_AGRPL|nr:mesoderm induction early response protein 1-like isoform X1 [Agrilus planipennis]XP_018325538.2 mesoderm induction early response protein 1-like isoform X1 [Agrilus planipennis]XP_025831395.1 mesoderm induction early response protein 1-like isoform X1 [Agrilus planipennis]XP_025831396.1 mesoderm induction early response protein 1-like isoform X1 [Agrilus planipennis]
MADVVTVKKDDTETASANKDKLFDPSIDMLVNDFDDERTLEEEEALAAGEAEDPVAELSNLQKESNMPLEELLAMYGYRDIQENGSPEEDEQDVSETMEEQESESLDPPESESKLHTLYENIPDNDQDASRLLRSVSRVSEEEDEDYDYTPDEDEWRKVNKTIMVGSDYQAQIPEGLCHYDDALPYENEDKLLWDPNSLSEEVVEDFLRRASSLNKPLIPMGTQVRDDEQALYLLQQCGQNVEEALRRIRINVMPSSENMSLWSEEECKNFESGVRCFGKNFHLIQQNKVRTRSVGELVQFYYLWKKSERHDIFANKTRLEKKKYTLHPGLTDFMDRFLEDQDGRDRSSSPNVQVNTSEKKLVSDNNSQNSKAPLET